MIWAWIAAGVCLALVFVRQYFGVDFTDESFSVALPYRFALGDRPFVDEMSMAQTAALFSYPLIKLRYLIHDSTEGIILFARRLYLVFTLGIAIGTFSVLKKRYPGPVSLLVSMIPIVFIPYNLSSLSYNVLGIGFLQMALLIVVANPSCQTWLFIAGMASGLAAFSYPTLAAVGLPLSIILFCLNRNWKLILCYGVGALLAPALVFLFFRISPENFLASVKFVSSVGAKTGHNWTLGKMQVLLGDFWNAARLKLAFLVWLGAFVCCVKRPYPKAALALAAIFPVLLFQSNRASHGGLGVHGFMLFFGLSAPIFYLLIPRTESDRRLFFGMWVPSLVACAIMSWSSGNGIVAGGIGMIPGAIVAAVFLWRVTEKAGPLALLPVTLVLAILLYGQKSAFIEDPLSSLTTKIQTGPFRGLYTSPAKAQYLDELTREVKKVESDGTAIFFYPHFPGGYLLTTMRPATPFLWSTCHEDNTQPCLDYFASRKPVASIRIKRLFYHSGRTDELAEPGQSRIEKLIAETGNPVVSQTNFDIFLSR